MSKVVKAVGKAIGGAVKSVARAVTSVVKGVVNVVKKVVKASITSFKKVAQVVQKIAKSKIGKVIIAAAAIYFGGAALAGGFSASASGGSFLAGMGTGVSNAAASLSTAWSSALSGNFAQAGSSIAQGFSGQAASTLASGAVPAAASTVAANGVSTIGGATITPSGSIALQGAAPAAAKAATGFSSLSPLTQYGLISGGMQLAGGVIQGVGQSKAIQEQQDAQAQAQADERARNQAAYEEAVRQLRGGSTSVGAGQDGSFAPTSTASYDALAEARAINDRQRAAFDQQYGAPRPYGIIAQSMQNNPMTNNNFPVYNPYYYRG